MVAVGERAPDVLLRRADGSGVRLAELLRNGPLVLVFFKTSCPVCQFTFPYLNRLASAPAAPAVVAVSQDSAEATRAFAARYAPALEMLFDTKAEGYPASNRYGINHVPTVLALESDSLIAHGWTGFLRLEFEKLGRWAGQTAFAPGEKVPFWTAGCLAKNRPRPQGNVI